MALGTSWVRDKLKRTCPRKALSSTSGHRDPVSVAFGD
jgi:hypothetical protein